MTARRLLIFVGSLALLVGAMLTAVQLRTFTQHGGERAAPTASSQNPIPAGPMVLAAARPIPAGTLLRPDDVSQREAGAGERLDELVTPDRQAELLGAVVRRDVRAGEPLRARDIVKPGDRGFLAAVLAQGMRAVSIPVGPAASTAGLMAPGDRIDVVLMQNFAPDNADAAHKSVGETVLHDIRVIAIDQTLSTFSQPMSTPQRSVVGTSTPGLPHTLTLEVNEHQAEMIFVALELGKVELSLRSVGEETEAAAAAAPRSTWAEDVSPALRLLRRPEIRTAAAPAHMRPTLRITRGMKTENACVLRNGAVEPCDDAPVAATHAATPAATPAK